MKLIPTGSGREEVYIRRAIIVEELSPLIGTSVPCGMYFTKIYELRATLTNLGEVKIIVGERNNKRMIHYCITKKNKRVAEMPSITMDRINYSLKDVAKI